MRWSPIPWRQRGNKKKTHHLWGQEFSLSKDGLAEEQVVQFVNDLLAKHRAQLQQQQQQQPAEPMPHLTAKRIIAEAERDASNLRQRAKREIEAEAVRLIAEARQKAQDIVNEARRQSKASAELEAQSILDTAAQKAQLTEAQALQTASLFLIRAREEIRDRLTSETKDVYQRLLFALQELMGTAQSVETDWASKRIEPWWGSPAELKDYQATLMDALIAGRTDAEVLASEEAGQEVQAQPDAGQEEEAVELPDEEPRATDTSALREEMPRKEAPPDLTRPEMRPQPEEPPISELTRVVLGENATAPEEVPTPQARRAPVAEAQAAAAPRLYSGEVDFVIIPPVSVAQVTKLYTHLQSIPDLKMLRTAGSWDQGTVVTVGLERPVLLLKLLSDIPWITVTPGGHLLKGLGDKDKTVQAISITFKAEDTSPAD